MNGIRLPDPINGRFVAPSEKTKLGFGKQIEKEVSFGLPNNSSPRYAPKYDIKDEPVSTLRMANNVPQERFLGRNAYFSADNTNKEVTNQPQVVNATRKIGVTKKYNDIIRDKRPINFDSIIYRNLNNTIGSNYTEKISSLDSFEYKYYRTNDPDLQSNFINDYKDTTNLYQNDNDNDFYKHELDKDRIVNYALLQKLRNTPRIVVKDRGTSTSELIKRENNVSKSVQVSTRDKKKYNKNIGNEIQSYSNDIIESDCDKIRDEITITTKDRMPLEIAKITTSDNEYIDNRDIYKYYDLTKDELFSGFGSIGLAISKIFSLTGKGVLYLCSSISDNTETLFENEVQNKFIKDLESRGNCNGKSKSTVKNVKIHEPETTGHNGGCTCNSHNQCDNDYSNLPDLHINYETALSEDGMYRSIQPSRNGGVYVNGNRVETDRNKRHQRHFNVDIGRQINNDNYRYENRRPERSRRQSNHKRNDYHKSNEYYDENYERNNFNKEDYFERNGIDQQYTNCFNNDSPNLKIDFDTEIEDYDYDGSSKNTFDPEYPQLPVPSSYMDQYNRRPTNQYNKHMSQTFNNNQQHFDNRFPNNQYNNGFTNDRNNNNPRPNPNQGSQLNNQFNSQNLYANEFNNDFNDNYTGQFGNQQFSNNQQQQFNNNGFPNSQLNNQQYNNGLPNNQINNQSNNDRNNQGNQLSKQFNNQPNYQLTNQFLNGNNMRQREMQMEDRYDRDGRMSMRMDNTRNVNEYLVESKYNLNRPQFENESSEQSRFNAGPIVQEPSNMIPARIVVTNPTMVPEAFTPRLMDLKKEVTIPNGFDKYKTVEIVEKSRRNVVSVSSERKPNLTAYGSKDGGEMTPTIVVHGQAANSSNTLSSKDYDVFNDKKDYVNRSEQSSNEIKSLSNKNSNSSNDNEEKGVLRNESRQMMDIKSDMNKMFAEKIVDSIVEELSANGSKTGSGSQTKIDRISINNSISSQGVDTISINDTDSSRSDYKLPVVEDLSDTDSKKKSKRRVFPFLRSLKSKKESDN